MKTKVFGVLVLLFATFSCVKEKEHELQPEQGEERFAEFDPVVRFGLDTYMGESNDADSFTKTTYAGEDQYEIIFDKASGKNVRYERINWNWDPAATGPENKVDTVRIWSKDVFTKNNKLFSDYSPWYIPAVTNISGIKDSAADAKVLSTDEKDNFYWDLSKDPRYFFSVYPTPAGRTSLSVTAPTGTPPMVTVTGIIPRNQKYLKKKVDGNVIEYLPDMSNAYMYAAAKIPSADAGYVKVPLRFKPLFSAVKLKVTAADAGAEKYRLKKVELRTDLFYDDLHQSDPKRVNQPKDGTPLNGDFTAKFGTVPSGDDKKPEYTGDFTVTDYTGKDPAARDTTNKRLTIRIEETDRVWLDGGKEVNVTFLALPIQQEVMTIVYTFEVNDGGGNPKTDDKGNIIEVTRYLALQQKTTKTDNTGEHNEFKGRGWFPLPKATKLYVKSNVPEIQYFFDVVVQGNFPRTWKAGSKKPGPKTGESFATKDFYEAKDFYSVISYRDSADVLQPLRWKVTGYKKPTDIEYKMDNRPAWLNLRGDGPWKKVAPFDVDDPKHPGYPYTGTSSDFDPWDVPQGKGTTSFDLLTAVTKNGIVIGYEKFVRPFYNYTYYDAGAPDNDPRRPGWGWVNHGSYIHSTPDGEFVHHTGDGVEFPDSTGVKGWKGVNGEAYAYDLSSHDIYGNLTANFNGDIANATTANCYVVSAPGWYRFPAVYGNALKGGVDNYKAYNRDGTASLGIMGAFLDHTGTGIENPWITHKYTITSVDIVWDDANRMLSERYEAADTRILDRRPFCKEIDGKTYIYFYVDDIAQGNALIAAKSGNDIVWSWHIWAVTDPEKSLAEVKIQNNEKNVDGTTNPYKSIYGNDNSFWKEMDLGQNGKETKVPARFCDVEFTQFFKGKEVQKVVRRVYQSGVEDTNEIVPAYQWGRKDPMPMFKTPLPNHKLSLKWHASGVADNTHNTILHPDTFYWGDNNERVAQGLRYDNLWNTNVDSRITSNTSDDSANGSRERKVEKTIYDPSPPGYSLPNMYAYSGLNPYGPIQQVKIPNIDAAKNGVATNPATTFSSGGYVEFYCEYDNSATYMRKTSGSTIIFYARGRANGNNAGARQWYFPLSDDDVGAYYWTSEPAAWGNALHGRSFYFRGPDVQPAKGWYMYPVAGQNVDGQAKWQRTHGLTIRPMRQQPVSSP